MHMQCITENIFKEVNRIRLIQTKDH